MADLTSYRPSRATLARRLTGRRCAASAAMCILVLASLPAAADSTVAPAASAAPATSSATEVSPLNGALRLRWDGRQANPLGPLAAANAAAPGTAPPAGHSTQAEAELRGLWHRGPWALQAELLAWQLRPQGEARQQGLRVNALNLAWDGGAWQASAGKKVVEWDVGFGFRPNDVVQQTQRRSLLGSALAGRPLLQLEHFGARTATSLVWVNPQRASASTQQPSGPDESALAARWYLQAGALDAHAFARWAPRTRASLGAALAWVAGDSLALHASARWLQRHDSTQWQAPAAAGSGQLAASANSGQVLASNPWHTTLQGATGQWLLGAQWTGAAQQSLLVEAWHDGTAPADAAWRQWAQRNQALQLAGLALQGGQAAGMPAAALAGNLAWQTTPMGGGSASSNLRRDNVFARLAWQPGAWQWAADTLWHPADGGRLGTASLQWQGDQWQLYAAWRSSGGPARALLRQLPSRHSVVLSATRTF